MRIVCASAGAQLSGTHDLLVSLYGGQTGKARGVAGSTIPSHIAKSGLQPSNRAWDFLSLALAVVAADLAGHRAKSPDGWTREFELEVAVIDPDCWNSSASLIERLLGFLTTDRWSITFVHGQSPALKVKKPISLDTDSVVLVSGGLDSLIGLIDIANSAHKPIAVSQTVTGDAEKQRRFASLFSLPHYQVNHNIDVPDQESPPSQRARSLVFMAHAALVGSCSATYGTTQSPLFICENGFIAVNPPLTSGRLGSLSTRTAHPTYLAYLQELFDRVGLRLQITNPYLLKTKGEMLVECKDQKMLLSHAVDTTSCGRFQRFGFRHCGRCVPCLIRRAAFTRWGQPDSTSYVYKNIGKPGSDYSGYDDVRSAAIAVTKVRAIGVERWLGAALSSLDSSVHGRLRQMIANGLNELEVLLKDYKVL